MPFDMIMNCLYVSFDSDKKHIGKYGFGLIAEEIDQYFLGIIDSEEEDVNPITMDYGITVPILAEAIQELKLHTDSEIDGQ